MRKIFLRQRKLNRIQIQMNWASSSGPPSQLSIYGSLVTKAAIIASEMNQFFINKVKIIRNGIQYVPNLFSKCYEIMAGKQCRLNLQHGTVSKVNKLLKKLKNISSCSIDELDSFCIKISADLICKPLNQNWKEKIQACCYSVSLEQNSI